MPQVANWALVRQMHLSQSRGFVLRTDFHNMEIPAFLRGTLSEDVESEEDDQGYFDTEISEEDEDFRSTHSFGQIGVFLSAVAIIRVFFLRDMLFLLGLGSCEHALGRAKLLDSLILRSGNFRAGPSCYSGAVFDFSSCGLGAICGQS
ncbi:hypothetical protein U1Q18_030734 [Sarracenia purpurea var. burkii]